MEEFISFILDLVDDEFYQYLDYQNARYYFLNGGCLELVKVLMHYYPSGKVVINDKYNHIAFLYNGNIYDATGLVKEGKFSILENIEEADDYLGRGEIRFEHKRPNQAIIEELNKIDISFIHKLVKSSN